MYYRNIFQSFAFALHGLKFMFQTERNMRIHSFIALGVILASILLEVRHIELLFVCFSIALVFVAEAANTAFELLLDFVHGNKYHPNIKLLKDITAGGVLIAAMNALVIGIIIFGPKLLNYFSR